MDAKRQIIFYIESNMSGENKVRIPGHPLDDKYGAARDAVVAQQAEVAKLLREYDAAEAAALEGTTALDRIHALMDAAIKRLDKEYSTEKIAKDKVARLKRIEAQYRDAVEKLADLKARQRRKPLR